MTVLEANGEMDAGDVWASVAFPMRDAAKSSLYRNEVTEAAVVALKLALARIERGEKPMPLDDSRPGVRGRLRPPMQQSDRAIDWRADPTATVLRKIRAADGTPGVRDEILDEQVYLYDAHPEGTIEGRAGEVIAQRDGAILRATVDGAVWITHLKRATGDGPQFKLPAASVLGDRLCRRPRDAARAGGDRRGIRPGGRSATRKRAPSATCTSRSTTARWVPLHASGSVQAYLYAKTRPTRVIVLMGGPDFWSNGIDLNLIEASAHPADESWRNINAIDDLVREIVATEHQLTIAAMQGNAGAGGVFVALAADRVYARDGVILNPHYKAMGNLYGSEYWTYLLPRRVAPDRVHAITQGRQPVAAQRRDGDGSDRRPFRPDAGPVPGGDRRARARACRRSCVRASRRRAQYAPQSRRGGEAARHLPRRGARADEAEFLWIRPQLSRRALPLRIQGAAVADPAVARPSPESRRPRCPRRERARTPPRSGASLRYVKLPRGATWKH